jgi:allophanate hydrolase subunit 2
VISAVIEGPDVTDSISICHAVLRSPSAACGPSDGLPAIPLDYPVTGGYPVVGVVRESDHPLLAQAAPGTQLRFQLLPYRT